MCQNILKKILVGKSTDYREETEKWHEIQRGSSGKAEGEKNKKKSGSNLWIPHREGKKKHERSTVLQDKIKPKSQRTHKYFGAKQ